MMRPLRTRPGRTIGAGSGAKNVRRKLRRGASRDGEFREEGKKEIYLKATKKEKKKTVKDAWHVSPFPISPLSMGAYHDYPALAGPVSNVSVYPSATLDIWL